ncbi:ceramide kinase [Diachasmimorpha longicaudata]|uniref:ceramide kinase n=1 Tax=Diachasmimorpha longicaudata TaxID=58733 RepID=UPI0030B90E22
MEAGHFPASVLLNTFVIKKKRCKVYFHRGTIIWETEKPPYTRWTLPLTDALAVNYGDNYIHESWIGGQNSAAAAAAAAAAGGGAPALPSSPTSFILHYAARRPNNRWSHHTVVMYHSDSRQIASWVITIRNYLLNISSRPRKILVFINPYGGKKQGEKVWKKKVQPLMRIVGIETKAIMTERAGHIKDIILNSNLDDFQAIISIGGDGTFAEVFNSLVLRTANDLQINSHDSNVIFPQSLIPVGIIPCGSTDTLAYSLHGTTDVQTSVIHIIFGDTVGLDLCSVHENENLHRLYASVLSYGYLGDIARESEQLRWMGPRRYDYSGFKKIINNKGYEGEIVLLSDPCHPAASTRCMQNCSRCISHACDEKKKHEISRKLTVRGKFFMVNGANVSCACSKCPQGFSPHCHIGDGCLDIILVRHTSLINNIRMLWRLSSKKKNVYDLPFVEVYRAREFTFHAFPQLSSVDTMSNSHNKSTVSVWNCDGEVLEYVDVKIRVHCQLLKVFTRRMQEPVKESKWLCFP